MNECSKKLLSNLTALVFYSKFTREVNWFAEHKENGKDEFCEIHFPGMEENEFIKLIERFNRVYDAIESEAGSIVQCFTDQALKSDLNYKLKKVENKTCKNWQREFWIETPETKKTNKNHVQIGIYIFWENVDTLYVASWIWVKGVASKKILEAIKSNSQEFKEVANNPDTIFHPNTLPLANVKLLEEAEKGDTINAFVSTLFAPLLKISPEAWEKLFDMANKIDEKPP